MKKYDSLKLFLLIFAFMTEVSFGQIISQYIETDSGTTPKGVEIWNNTLTTLDFSVNNLVIKKGINGGAPSPDITISSGTLDSGEVMVVGTSDIGTYLTNEGLTDILFVSKSFTYNGDDALTIELGGAQTDVFGTPNSDPGTDWNGNGVSTRNQNIALKDGIISGSNGFTDPSSRFTTINSNPSGTEGLQGFGIAPVLYNLWTGTTDENWNTTSNWNSGTVPTGIDNVFIPAGLTNYPTVNTSIVSPASIIIESGATAIFEVATTANVTYKRNLPTANWYLMSSPVSGETIEDLISKHNFATGSGSNIGLAPYTNSGANPWVYQESTSSGAISSGTGVSVKLENPGDATFTGSINSDPITTPISIGDRTAFNLIGNPYTAYLNSTSFLNDFANNNSPATIFSEKTIWLWDGTQYITKNLAEPIEIAPAQGFFVSAALNANASMNTSMLSHQTTDTFMRNTPKTLVELLVVEGKNKRSTKIYYIDSATNAFDDGYDSSLFSDAKSSFNVFTELVAHNKGKKLAIQSVSKQTYQNTIVPVGLSAEAGKEIVFSVNAKSLPNNAKVYLEDRENGIFTNLSEEPYKVTLNKNTKGIGQFYLHTSTKELSNNDEVIQNIENVSIYKSTPTTLTIAGLRTSSTKVSIFSISGKEVVNTSIKSNGVTSLKLPTLSSGIYIVKIDSELGKISKKIVL